MPIPYETWRLTHPPMAGADPEAEPEAPPESDTPAPWGDDFDPQKAWNTIQHQRAKEKEYETGHKAWQRLEAGEDEESFRMIAEKFGYEIPEGEEEEHEPEDDEEYEDEDDPYLQRLHSIEQSHQSLEERIAERERKQALDDFMEDLSQKAKGRGVELHTRETQWILQESLRNGFTPQSTEKALDAHLEWLKEREQATINKYRESKRAPHVSPVGKEGTNQPNLDDPKERIAHMRRRFEELNQES